MIFILILLNAFFASSEIALLSVNEHRIEKLAAEDKRAQIVLDLIAKPGNFLAAIQIGITLAGFLASAFASESFADIIVTSLLNAGVNISESVLKTASVVLITLLLSYFTLVLGELAPKRLAMKKAQSIALFAAKPLYYLAKLTAPFVKLLTASTNIVVRMLGIDPDAEDDQKPEEEISMLLEEGESDGNIDKTEKNMIINIFEFDDKPVSSIMTPRTSIEALELDTEMKEVLSFLAETDYSRIPVYDDSLDCISGILNTKELVKLSAANKLQDVKLVDQLKPVHHIPEFKKLDEAFLELKQRKSHMAIVVDEYGGTSGLITMEDLIEEIVGNIYDEYDDYQDNEIIQLEDNRILVKGSVNLSEVEKLTNTVIPDKIDNYSSIAGYIIARLGRIPKPEERPQIETADLKLTIDKIIGKRIETVLIERRNKN
jgi:putative hemolysin